MVKPLYIYDGRDCFSQWDLNVKISSTDFKAGDEIHFYNIRQPKALPVLAYMLNGKVVADVPNILLQDALPLFVYKYESDETSAYTKEEYSFEVKQRPQPEDYFYTETEVLSYKSLDERITALESGNDGGEVVSSPIVRIDGNTDNPIYLRELESGTYVLYGKFKPFNGSSAWLSFSSSLLVSVVTKTAGTHVQVFYPVNNVVQFLNITDDAYERTNVYLNNLAELKGLPEVTTADNGKTLQVVNGAWTLVG